MQEQQKRHIVENEFAYLPNGLKIRFAGWKNNTCATHGANPGSYECSWEKALEVISRPSRRFEPHELSRSWRSPWAGLTPDVTEFQTEADYYALIDSGNAWWV